MLFYLIRRLFIFATTLVVITLIGFIISIHAPVDPLQQIQGEEETASDRQFSSQASAGKAKAEILKKLGLDRPVFYFSIRTLADIDTLYKIPDRAHRQLLKRVSRESGNPELTMQWFFTLREAIHAADVFVPDSTVAASPGYAENLTRLKFLLNSIPKSAEPQLQKSRMDSIHRILSANAGFGTIKDFWLKARQAEALLQSNKNQWKKWVPVPEWYGLDNQYHLWLFGNGQDRRGIIRGDFGISYRDGQEIGSKISGKIKWSLVISVFAILIAYLVSVPAGILAGYKKGGLFDRISSPLLFVLYAVPAFFAGTLLLVVFANPDFLDWFPSGGVRDPATFNPNWPFWMRVRHYLPYLVLPVLTYVYGSLAFITRLTRSGISSQLSRPYIRTARAKGLKESSVLLKHAFRNTLLPLITLLSRSLPVAFSGSVIIESIFSIPGMGLEIYQSVTTYDYPMIIAVFTIFGFLTVIGYLLADIGYAMADPRIRLNKKY